ncbi:MAG TPA: hypothetical protein VFD07_12010 [Candidatus Krumholzibacteria bacterium]|nr:hypothetical protein [Candidatus Krumholzibacteria bacterium]
MFNKMLPQRIDNTYRGRKLALWLFALVVIVKILQCLMVIFNGDFIVRSADGIPLDTYTPAGAQTVLAIWALLGLERLIMFLLCVLVLVRYRSVVAFMLALLALEYLARQLILYFVPLVRTGTPVGPIVNLILFCLTIVGLALSLWKQRDLGAQDVPVTLPRR